MQTGKRILVAALNDGTGHAARCMPIIEALVNHGFLPVIASDGIALELLKKEFPLLRSFELPPYRIEYVGNGGAPTSTLLLKLPGMFSAVRKEHNVVSRIVKEEGISGIISDSRLGAYNRSVPGVMLTHQLTILSGATWLTTALHRSYLKKFTECWVPDIATSPNLSGKIGHTDDSLKLKYIGPVSRLLKKPSRKKYDLLVMLSGIEPQRTLLEEKLRKELLEYPGTVIFVRGVLKGEKNVVAEGRIRYYNFMDTAMLEQAFNDCGTVLCRPDYNTIMDLATCGKRAFFIPTPGIHEQEYLAKKLRKANLAPYCLQNKFRMADLQKAELYNALKNPGSNTTRWKDLFGLFEGEGKL